MTYPESSLEAARWRANAYRSKAKQGESPAAMMDKAATAGGFTVEALSRRYLET